MACYSSVVAKGFIVLLLLVTSCAAAVYFSMLTPQVRAAKHLEFIHQSITEMHPAVLDSSAIEFQTWYKSAYKNTNTLLPLVHSVADERALINYYFAGYKDSHVSGGLVSSIYSSQVYSPEKWAGWLLKATISGYEVAYSLGGKFYPEIGSQLISCDNQPIDELLQYRYAPYLDMRWNLLIARDSVAKALTQKRAGYGADTVYTEVADMWHDYY
jgi:hypothetical protein